MSYLRQLTPREVLDTYHKADIPSLRREARIWREQGNARLADEYAKRAAILESSHARILTKEGAL